MSLKSFLLALCFVFVFASLANGQFFQTGEDPSSVKWRQIKTPNFQVIFPEEFENEAKRLSAVLEKVYAVGGQTLGHKPRKISVVLHTRGASSNGLVAWAPKRIELFTTPNQDIYSQDWLEQLAIHEFRHVVQMDKIQRELPFLIKAIFGEQAAATVAGAYLPFWFLEGDAVVAETALSESGRGRTASFNMEIKAQLAEIGKYSFDKAYLGSYKDYVPNHYKMGYLLVGKSREKYGADLWTKTLQLIGKKPWSITPMNSSLKRQTGTGVKGLYNQIFDELKEEWGQQAESVKTDTFSVVSPKRRNYTQYLHPAVYRDSLIFAYRTSIDDIGRFVLIHRDKSEEVIYTPGYVFDQYVSVSGNLAIWAERKANLRWTHADRSVIQLLDLSTRKVRRIKTGGKLFSPAISPDLKMFVAVEMDQQNNCYLSFYDLSSGKLAFRFKTDDNQYFIAPCWDEKGQTVYTVCLSPKGKHIASFDLNLKTLQTLTKPTFANLNNPVYHSGQLFFSSDFAGTDNLYTLDLATQKIFGVFNAAFGANFPTVKTNNQVVFSNYSSSGYQIASAFLDVKDKRPLNDLELQPNSLADRLAAQETGIAALDDSIAPVQVDSEKYSKSAHLFNFHSWAPMYMDIDNYSLRPGVSLFSQNKLGTAETRLGYDYNTYDRTGQLKGRFTYSGFYPEFSVEVVTGKHASKYLEINNLLNDTTIRRYSWQETNISADVTLPLNISRGRFSRYLYPNIQYSFNSVKHNPSTPDAFYSGDYHALSYRFFYSNTLMQSVQNLQPRWGQQLSAFYRHTLTRGNDLGTLAGAESVLFFPGLAKNDGFRIYQGVQEKIFHNSYSFSNGVRFPRGYSSIQNNRMYTFSVDYGFSILYPDLSIGKLCYIKRVKSSLFYDFAWLSLPAKDEIGRILLNYRSINMKSMGVELTSDLHVLRFFAPIELGIRGTYLPEFNEFQFNMLFSVNLNGY